MLASPLFALTHGRALALSRGLSCALTASLCLVGAQPGRAELYVEDGTEAGARRPNIVLIMVDDMGYSDLGCYGSEIKTPNIDRIAARGVRFTQFYVTPKCAPTRNSLLSGRYPPPVRTVSGAATLAELLGSAGYATFMVGKTDGALIPEMKDVLARGFDRCFGNMSGGNYFRDDKRRTYLNDLPYPRPEGFYKTDAETDFALQFIEQDVEPDQPFFLYLAYHAPHWPLHAKPADIARHAGRYSAGPEAVRRARHERMIELGIVQERWALSPSAAGDWDGLSDAQKEAADLRMAVHAAMLDCVDQNVGRLIAKLEELEKLDDTLILFLSDNGACRRDGVWGKLIAGSRFGYRYDAEATVGGPDSHFGIGRSWANACNTPFRRYKLDLEEGGIASPLILAWPNGLAARGTLVRDPGQVVDIVPTCLEAAGIRYTGELDGRSLPPLDGESLLPLTRGAEPIAGRAFYWYWDGSRAIRADGYKAIRAARGSWTVYDMGADRTELHDLAAERPELTKRLAARWESWFTECHGAPYDPATIVFPIKGLGEDGGE